MEKTLKKLKGGNSKMRLTAIIMAAFLVMGIFTSAGIVLAQEGNSGGEDGQNSVTISVSPTNVRAVQIAGEAGVVSSAQALQVFPADSEVLDSQVFNTVIDEVDNSLGESGRKVGFVKGTYGKGYFMDSNKNHLGFVQLLYVNALVTDSSDALEAVQRTAGRVDIDGNQYKITEYKVEENNLDFTLVSIDGKDKGRLYLSLIASYDEGARKVWEGKIDLKDTEGIVDLVTVTNSVRKASQNEIQNARQYSGENAGGSIMPYPEDDATQPGLTSSGTVEGQSRGFFGRIIDYFRAERV